MLIDYINHFISPHMIAMIAPIPIIAAMMSAPRPASPPAELPSRNGVAGSIPYRYPFIILSSLSVRILYLSSLVSCLPSR